MTEQERALLDKLNSGTLDGLVGDYFTTSGGSDVWMEIKNGVPVQYKQGPGGKFFNNRENEHYEGVLHVRQKWTSDSDKLAFLQKFGWLMSDADAKAYSALFKPTR